MRVVVVGTRTHELLLSVGEHPARVVEVVSDPLAAADHTLLPSVTPNERLALVALAETYLLPHPRHDPAPRTYYLLWRGRPPGDDRAKASGERS